MIAHVKALRSLGVCDPGVRYAADYATAQEAWDECECPSWLAWLVARIDRRQGALVACLCARYVVHRSGQFQAEIESLLGQIEAWAWGADVDPEPVRQRLWAIYRAPDAAFFAGNTAFFTAASVAYWSGVDAAHEAASAASAAAALPGSHADLCDLIRSAVPRCPLEVAS